MAEKQKFQGRPLTPDDGDRVVLRVSCLFVAEPTDGDAGPENMLWNFVAVNGYRCKSEV